MTAKESYYKAYVLSNKPLGMLFYVFNQNKNVVHHAVNENIIYKDNLAFS